jgi:hypothetical protein
MLLISRGPPGLYKIGDEDQGKTRQTVPAAALRNENARGRAAGGKSRNEIDVCNMLKG